MAVLPMNGGSGSSGIIETVIGTFDSYANSGNIDVSEILPNDYNKLTVDNFYLKDVAFGLNGVTGSANVQNNIISSYNPSTGILVLNAGYWSASGKSFTARITYKVVAVYGGNITHLQPFGYTLAGSGDIYGVFHDFDKRYTKIKLVSSTNTSYVQLRYYASQGATVTVVSMVVGTTYDIPTEYYDGTQSNDSGLVLLRGGNSAGVTYFEFS